MNLSPAQIASLALVAFGVTEFTLRSRGAAQDLKPTAADKGSTPVLLCCYALVVAFFFVAVPFGVAIPRWLRWAGVVLAYLGLGVRWWAMTVLGRFYTRTLITAPGQPLVTAGPYRLVRHPGYLGSLFTWFGTALAQGRLWVALIVLGLLLAAYGWRISAEERMLASTMGPVYVAYQGRSWRLIPLVF